MSLIIEQLNSENAIQFSKRRTSPKASQVHVTIFVISDVKNFTIQISSKVQEQLLLDLDKNTTFQKLTDVHHLAIHII